MPEYDLDLGIARENLSRLLSACYYQPAPEFAEERLFDSMLAAATRIDPLFAAQAKQLGGHFAAEGQDALLLDYTRLFLGPNHIHAKPYGSVWLEGGNTVMGESTVAVQALYQEGGFDMSEDFREVPDHIAAELEFLYLLLYRENEARRDGQHEAQRAKADLRRRFLQSHLGMWVQPFTSAMKTGAQSRFYRALAELTAGFIAAELRNTFAV